MATINGAWAPNGSANARMRLRIVVNVPNPVVGQSSVTVTGSCWIDAGPYSFNDSSNVFSVAGSLLGASSSSKSVNLSGGGSQQLMTFSKVVTLTGSAQGFSLAFSLSGVNYIGATASVSTTVSVPAKVADPVDPTTQPNAPSSLSFSYANDKSILITYTATEATNKPIDYIQVVRMRSGSSDYTLGNIPFSGGGGNVRDTGTSSQNRYRWAARSWNSWGASGWTYSGYIKTTPSSGPYNVKLSRSGSSVAASWDRPAWASNWDRQEIRYQYGASSASWSGWSSLSAGISATSFTPTDNVVRIQVRGVTTEGGTRYSPEGLSGWITQLQPPTAPTPTAPNAAQLVGNSTFSWVHNSLDGTGQTYAVITWRVDGGSWNIVNVPGSTSSKVISLPAGRIEWQVKTKGEHADYGPSSPIKSFTVANKPTATIDTPAPGAAINSNKLNVGLTYTDASGAPMTGWRRQLVRAGVVIEDVSGTGARSTLAFTSVLSNESAYTANIWVTSGNGLTSNVVSRTFTTSFQLPHVPVLDNAAWDPETGIMSLSVTSPATYDSRTYGLNADGSAFEKNGATLLRTNLATAPRPSGTGWASGGSIWTLTTDTDGDRMGVLTSSSATIFSATSVGASTTANTGAGVIKVSAGQSYTVSLESYVWFPGSTVTISWRFMDSSGAAVGTPGEQATLFPDGANEWSRSSGSFTAPTGAYYLKLSVTILAPETKIAGEHSWINKVMVAKSSEVGEYFDGSTTGISDKIIPESVRIERSEDSGETWELVEAGLPPDSGIGDERVPLNLEPPAMWRAVSVSSLGTESVGLSITVASPSNRVMISNGDALLSFLVDIGLGAVEGHEVVFEDYLGQESPTAHFGVSRPVSAAVTGTLLRSSDRSIFKKLLGTEVFYRDPDSRAFVAVLDEGGFSSSSKGPRSKQVAYNVRKVTPYG